MTEPVPLTPAERRRALEFVAYRQKFSKLLYFRPYPKQLAFYALGKTKRERLFMAGTQVGKSEAGAFEAALHATGRYPEWWPGKRFDKPTRGWCSGITSMDVRNVQQRKLCGTPGVEADWGTGQIPKECLIDRSRAPGIVDAIDQLQVRHVTGGTSIIQFKSYEQGRAKFQGDTIHYGWADEEPDPNSNSTRDIYDEFLARLTGDGLLFTTFTPLFGPTRLVESFTAEDHPDRGFVTMDLDEAEHFTPEERERRLAGYKAHERDARKSGIPKLGSGAIFLTPEENIIEAPLAYIPGIPGSSSGASTSASGIRSRPR
jgi:phage terminase large subunit-like protein